MSSGASKKKDNYAGLLSAVQALAGTRVMVGIPGDQSKRVNDDGTVSPINNAALGYLMENGSPANNIPERKFLVPGVSDAKDSTVKYLRQAGVRALSGDAAGADRNFHSAGLTAQAAVKKRMSTGPFQKLSASTLAARRRRGVTRETPLVDTANLQNHITYVVRKKKG